VRLTPSGFGEANYYNTAIVLGYKGMITIFDDTQGAGDNWYGLI
jgi:hypothetical protein